MIVLVHVLIALSSAIYATVAVFKPSKYKLNVSYGLVGATVISGTYLVMSTHSALTPSCIAGLSYIAGISLVLVFARHRLSSIEVRSNKK